MMIYKAMPFITVFSYIAAEIYKLIFKADGAKRGIPIVVMIVGGCLGVVIHYTVPALTLSSSVWDAVTVGIIGGESATGANQIIKQFFYKAEKGEKG